MDVRSCCIFLVLRYGWARLVWSGLVLMGFDCYSYWEVQLFMTVTAIIHFNKWHGFMDSGDWHYE